MKKIKQIDYDKMLALLELGIPADAWNKKNAKLENVLEFLEDMGPLEVERVLTFCTRLGPSSWLEEGIKDGSIVCYTLVEADDDEES